MTFLEPNKLRIDKFGVNIACNQRIETRELIPIRGGVLDSSKFCQKLTACLAFVATFRKSKIFIEFSCKMPSRIGHSSVYWLQNNRIHVIWIQRYIYSKFIHNDFCWFRGNRHYWLIDSKWWRIQFMSIRKISFQIK